MKKKSEFLKISASSLKCYESCARKYYFQYIEKIKVDKKTPHLELGNFVHAVLESFHNEAPNIPQTDWPKRMAELCNEQKVNYELSLDNQKKAQGMLSTYLAMLYEEGLPPVLANEQEFSIKINDANLLIRGFIDRIDRDEAGNFHVVDYKGLALTTPIPTPEGWTTMGKLNVGDYVLGNNGLPTKVLVKSQIHNRPCYKLTLSDKSEVICDNVHLWNIGYRDMGYKRNYDTTLSAEELFQRFTDVKKNGGSGSFIIQNHKPLELPETELPIDPWLLGAWLGDGTSKTGSFTVGAQDLEDTLCLIKSVWSSTSVKKEKGRNVYGITCLKKISGLCGFGHLVLNEKSCNICSNASKKPSLIRNRWNMPLSGYLTKENLLRNKHIPVKYLRASYNQRLELLRGLMDTDGSWNPLRKRCVFVSADQNLAKSVVELIRTFGLTVQTFTAKDKNDFISYRIEFRPVGFNPFKLKRKAQAFATTINEQVYKTHLALRRTITNIEKVDSVPTQCISVDATDRLYLCGEGLIPTHNTGKSKYLDDTQLLIYGLYLLENYPEFERFKGSYLLLNEGSKLLSYIFTKTDLERNLKKIKKIADDIRSDKTWDPKPSFLCQYCDYENICPAMLEKRGGWSVKSTLNAKTTN